VIFCVGHVNCGTLICVLFRVQIYRLYALAGSSACSDSTTNTTFQYLGQTLPSIYHTSLANVLLESGLALVGSLCTLNLGLL
jgi:hypothetical protein